MWRGWITLATLDVMNECKHSSSGTPLKHLNNTCMDCYCAPTYVCHIVSRITVSSSTLYLSRSLDMSSTSARSIHTQHRYNHVCNTQGQGSAVSLGSAATHSL